MFITAEQFKTSVTIEQIATGNGLHVDLDEIRKKPLSVHMILLRIKHVLLQ